MANFPVQGIIKTTDQDLRNERIDELESQPSAQEEGASRDVSDALQDCQEPMLELAMKRVKEAYSRDGIKS